MSYDINYLYRYYNILSKYNQICDQTLRAWPVALTCLNNLLLLSNCSLHTLHFKACWAFCPFLSSFFSFLFSFLDMPASAPSSISSCPSCSGPSSFFLPFFFLCCFLYYYSFNLLNFLFSCESSCFWSGCACFSDSFASSFLSALRASACFWSCFRFFSACFFFLERNWKSSEDSSSESLSEFSYELFFDELPSWSCSCLSAWESSFVFFGIDAASSYLSSSWSSSWSLSS